MINLERVNSIIMKNIPLKAKLTTSFGNEFEVRFPIISVTVMIDKYRDQKIVATTEEMKFYLN